jgi:hypothetical protein
MDKAYSVKANFAITYDLPAPIVGFSGKIDYSTSGGDWTRYHIPIVNRAEYPDKLFEGAPYLPAIGLNTSASRAVVYIYTGAGSYIYGFCALGTADNMGLIWFAKPQGQTPPPSIYVKIIDRLTGASYQSKNSYWLDVTESVNGSVNVSDAYIEDGTETKVIATANPGFVFSRWDGDVPEDMRPGSSITLTMNQARSITPCFTVDADLDTLPDNWEKEHFGDTVTKNGSQDSDDDGMTDIEEYIAGTNPNDPTSKLKIECVNPKTQGKLFIFKWKGVPGRTYKVERMTDLSGTFETIASDIVSGSTEYTMTCSTEGLEKGFFRIKVSN